MAKPELGEKRRCLSCETKYYDLGKDPIICPKCGAVFELVMQEKPGPEKDDVKPEKEKQEVETANTDDDPDVISLEEADEDDGETVDGEDIPKDIPDIDVDDDSDEEADGPFLEDDDDDDDMSDIISVPKDDKEDT